MGLMLAPEHGNRYDSKLFPCLCHENRSNTCLYPIPFQSDVSTQTAHHHAKGIDRSVVSYKHYLLLYVRVLLLTIQYAKKRIRFFFPGNKPPVCLHNIYATTQSSSRSTRAALCRACIAAHRVAAHLYTNEHRRRAVWGQRQNRKGNTQLNNCSMYYSAYSSVSPSIIVYFLKYNRSICRSTMALATQQPYTMVWCIHYLDLYLFVAQMQVCCTL